MNYLNINPLDVRALSADDILLVPSAKGGGLESRSHAKLAPYIYSAPMDTVTGLILARAMVKRNQIPVIHRFLEEKEMISCLAEFKNTDAFFAIGKNHEDFLKNIKLFSFGCSYNVAIDVAHGDTKEIHDITRLLKKNININKIMSGSVCTPEAAHRAFAAGCTHIRIGIGPGAACTTRLMTGIGFPQLSAVYNIYKSFEHIANKPILIADGGIKNPGHVAKYLAVGADAVMMGSVFSPTAESAGWIRQFQIKPEKTTWTRTKYIKNYRGQSSKNFQDEVLGKANRCPEGASGPTIEKDLSITVASVLDLYEGAISSTISYLGLEKITDLKPHNLRFVEVTSSTITEGTPHGC